MLKARIAVDLPSAETQRSMGPVEWVRSLFGAQIDLRSGKEELTVCAFSLVEGLIAGFARAGVADVLSFLVDRQVVYLDSNDVPDDLPLIAQAAQAAGVLDRRFRELHLVLAHKDDSVHTILDTRITNRVVLGEAEMQVELSGRLVELQIRPGETAEQYAERIKRFAADPDSYEPGRQRLELLAQRVAAALATALIGAKVSATPASVQIIRPDALQLHRFRGLGFGDEVQSPQYRPVPSMQRAGAYADPFYYYYYDPYYDFMSYVLVDSMLHQAAWHSPHVHVVDPAGTQLFTGNQALAHAGDSWVGNDAISFDVGGGLNVSDTVAVPDNDRRSSSWLSAATPGFSGGSSCSSASSCSSTSSSSCNSASSCGSSCNSASSCGSSCSSGSSCGSSSD